jgi:hypothetical protein
MDEKLLFVLFLVALIIVCALLPTTASTHAMERFANYDNNSFVIKKSCAYFPYVSTFIMSDSTSNPLNAMACPSTPLADCVPLKLFKFLPTYLDAMCSLSDIADQSTNHCSNFYIDNNTFADPIMYDSPEVCTTINGAIGQNKEQSKVRILSNNYVFMKRCVALKIDNVGSLSGVGVTAQYRVACAHSIDMMMLLRPCMILFPGIGLFNINMFKSGNPPLSSNSSSGAQTSSAINYSNKYRSAAKYTFDVSLISHVAATTPIAPPTNTGNIPLTSIQKSAPVYPTIYYFNYTEPADFFTATNSKLLKFNTLTLVFDQTYLSTNASTVITMPTDASANTCPQIAFQWNKTTCTFNVVVQSSLGSSDNMSVHPDFTACAIIGSPSLYHIIVSYTVDMLTIASYFRDLSTSTTSTFVTITQKALGGASPIYLQYPMFPTGAVAGSMPTVPTTDMARDLTGYAAMCPQTSIPNLAAVAKQLGYSLSSPPTD